MIFQGLLVARNCPTPLTTLDIKREFCLMKGFWKFTLKLIVISEIF